LTPKAISTAQPAMAGRPLVMVRGSVARYSNSRRQRKRVAVGPRPSSMCSKATRKMMGLLPRAVCSSTTAGNLYGTTGYGGTGPCTLLGAPVGCGTVYELSPPVKQGDPWTETVLYSFQGNKDGYVPSGDIIFHDERNLYGVTLFGGGKGTNCGDDLYPNCG
jgi:hypothetical protein